jgi:glycosyltransferase involved in cell wall biosynthesis
MAIVQPSMAPYRFACFSALAARPDIDLLVTYLSRGSQPYDWTVDEEAARFERIVLGARDHAGVHPLPLGIAGALRGFRPDVTVVGGWDEPSYYAIAALRPLLGRRVVVWSESTSQDRRRSGWRDRAKRAILHRADAVLVPGAAAREYAESIAPRVKRWFVAPNAIDNERFAAGAADARQARDAASNDHPTFIYVGRLDPEKGVDVLLRAWGIVDRPDGARLRIVGTGSQAEALRGLAVRLRLENAEFEGFVPQADLPGCYGRADAFVFPSLSDPWGLVINEAMASGLPVITTSAPGGARELVKNGENGLVVPPRDPNALAAAMSTLAADREARERMASASSHIVQDFSPGAWAHAVAGMAAAIR